MSLIVKNLKNPLRFMSDEGFLPGPRAHFPYFSKGLPQALGAKVGAPQHLGVLKGTELT